ncbi:MAG TPA: septum site-determining protein MinC [Bacillota bacterium]|jgi:septum site-determining protein MinC|nr:septum site-determining protein MinC [Bacillota bacterium]NLU55259.1 septum site-determining protein MinC [Bacillota bacterium]HOP53016.1 septum site-determining protein MinC [Bacillota bacterium]HPQ10769.1 septum site-determining protein MinC [Bacillota bacterium]
MDKVRQERVIDRMPDNLLRIKGSKHGIVVQFEEGDLEQAIGLLEEKLKENPGFFAGSQAILVFPEEAQLSMDILAGLYKVLEAGRVSLREIRRNGSVRIYEASEPETPKKTPDEEPQRQLQWVYRRLRSGDKLSVDGDLVLIGDVNPGAEISATGNILVWGCLQGVAHAGIHGDENARIMALKLKATQLRIAGFISRAPDQTLDPIGPEVARVGSGGIVIETWERAGKGEPLPFWRRLLHGRED